MSNISQVVITQDVINLNFRVWNFIARRKEYNRKEITGVKVTKIHSIEEIIQDWTRGDENVPPL